MPTYLSPEWIDALDHAVATDEELAGTMTESLVVGYRVLDAKGDEESSYHLRLAPSGCSAGPGLDDAEVVFETDRPTAEAVALGQLRAQRAFMAGRLRATGDLRALLGRPELVARLAELAPPAGG